MLTHEPVHTPWGVADQVMVHAEGITSYGTPSHGGFRLDTIRNAKVHAALREPSGYYDEDCAWAKVAFAFPGLFTKEQREAAIRLLKDYYPDDYEAATGAALAPGESHARDKRRFQADHADDWVGIAALGSDRHPGMVECIASRGGMRGEGGERRFLVPESEYRQRGPFGFVIDGARHRPCTSPSGFVTWRDEQTLSQYGGSCAQVDTSDTALQGALNVRPRVGPVRGISRVRGSLLCR